MRRYFYSLIASAVLLLAAVGASAQVGQLRGHVFIQQADGTKVPVAGAQVDVYRTDLPGKFPSKTNKSGEFVYAGLPYIGTYVIAVSAPNAAPTVRGGVKVGRDIDFELVMTPGNGQRFTEEQAKAGGGGTETAGPSSGESAADKAKREALEKQNAEIAESNKKIENANQVIGDSFKGGNTSLAAGMEADKLKKRDEAIKLFSDAVQHYDTGVAADPEHPGIPALLTNKSQALRLRGVDRFNMAVESKDEATRTSGVESAKADFKAAAEAANRAVDLLKKTTTPTEAAALKNFEANKYFALNARAESMRLFVTKVDSTQADAAITAYQEYLAVEPDAAKKSKAQNDMAQMLFDAGVHDKAKLEYEKILAERPDDPDALANMGMILYSLGYASDSEGKKDQAKAQYQQAANYLQTFVEKAPDTHRLKASAKEVIDALKAQNVQAEKPATRPRPGRRP